MRWAARELRRGTDAEAEPTFTRGRLAVEVHPERPTMGRAAAAAVSAHLRREVERHGQVAAIFASAPSQNEFLSALRDDAGIPWDRVTAFHLDEYIGVEATHPASFRRFLVDRLFAHVPVRAFHGLAGEAADPAAECARYAGLLRAERPTLAILGIGENGHLAFVDPPLCDFFEPADVRVVELDEPCRHQQVLRAHSLRRMPAAFLTARRSSTEQRRGRSWDRPRRSATCTTFRGQAYALAGGPQPGLTVSGSNQVLRVRP